MNKRQRKKEAKRIFCVLHKSIRRMYRQSAGDPIGRALRTGVNQGAKLEVESLESIVHHWNVDTIDEHAAKRLKIYEDKGFDFQRKVMGEWKPCCPNEKRTMAGGCESCGDPSF